MTLENIERQKGGMEFILLGVIVLLGILLSGGIAIPKSKNSYPPVIAVKPQSFPPEKNLQVRTFSYITTTPVPPTNVPTNNYCQTDNAVTNGCTCVQSEHSGVVCDVKKADGTCPDNDFNQGWPGGNSDCSKWALYYHSWGCDPKSCIYVDTISSQYNKYKGCAGGHDICFGKPVIYLYPEKDTLVNVKLTIPGFVYISAPLYIPTVGWQHVLAHPGGKLEYQGKKYDELYYESSVTKHVVPDNGVIIKISELKTQLLYYTNILGLLPNEQEEFLDYWLPKLDALQKPYIFFSLLSPEQKELVDHVAISPKPDTKIEFLAYFRAVTVPFQTKPLQTPKSPQRKGFTSVEWGGTIDY